MGYIIIIWYNNSERNILEMNDYLDILSTSI